MALATLGLSLLKVTLAAALGLLAVRFAARCAAAVRHAVLVTTHVAVAAIPILAAVAPPYVVSVEYRYVAEQRHRHGISARASQHRDCRAVERATI